jgi:hypothetical protein
MIVSLEPELLERLTRLDPQSAAVAEVLDDDLAAAVRRTASMRRVFYAAVLVVALYGTATGAVTEFDLPWWIAIGGIFALELGGVTFLSNADVRRRLGEHAAASRLLGGIIAAAAATFNVVTHGNRLLGGFFALMSVLGFVGWWLDVEAKRRDRLRARGLLPARPPTYELWTHWIRHPLITAQARSLAKAYPQMGLYGSLEAAIIVRRRERRDAALADVLRARIQTATGKQMADIAVLTYDMNEVARRLRASADYDGLTALLAAELTAEHVLHDRDDQAAVTARALLARNAQTRLPLTGTNPGPDEPAPSSDREEPSDTDAHRTPGQHGSPVDDTSRRKSSTLNGGPRTADGSAVLPPAGAGPGLPPARPTTGRGNTLRLVTTGESRSSDQVETVPPGPTANTSAGAPAGSTPPPDGRVRVTVIGEPAILDRSGLPIRGLRAKSMELLVFLAVRRDGAPLTEILDRVWPDVTVAKANQRLSTCLSNLRGIIRSVLDAVESANRDETADGPRPEPIVNTGSHYHLDPVIVTVDWWQLLDERRAGKPATTDMVLKAARARIADGYDYPWLDTDSDEPSADRPGPRPWEDR